LRHIASNPPANHLCGRWGRRALGSEEGVTFLERSTSEELNGVEELGRQGLAVEHGPQLLALGWATLRRLP
jgi:hypothetical protein